MEQRNPTPFHKLFQREQPLIGVIHVPALPGTPANDRPVNEIIRHTLHEAAIYRDANLDAVMIENMHDTPYLKEKVGPEVVASMTAVGRAVRALLPETPVGVQVLAAANREAIAVALAAELDFVRVEGFAFGHVADEGFIESCAGDLLRYRKTIGAERVQVWADVKKKHSAHAITADVNLAETVRAVAFFRADAAIVTGTSTGQPPDLADLLAAKETDTLPILLGSGITPDSVGEYWPAANGFIIGSYFKKNGHWANPVDRERVYWMMEKVNSMR